MDDSNNTLERYFEYGLDETKSPFLIPKSRQWGSNLLLKSSILAACLLLISFALSFHPTTVSISHFFLVTVYFLVGVPALIESVEDIMSFEINIDILMTLAAFSSVLIGSGMEGGLLLVLFALSGAMEDAVTSKAKSAINSLNKLSPTKATIEEADGTTHERAIQDVSLNTRILVKSGQVVPLDGTVVEGISSVNLVHLTGENFPIRKQKGDEVAAGSRNLEGALSLVVTRTSKDSTLSRIVQLITQAQESKPKLQRWFDSLSRSYALSIIGFAFLFAITLPYFLSIPFFGQEGSLYRSLAFLIAASPCALIIAIPIAYLSAISACAKKGILLKGGIALDALASCSIIAFDKTGTLTTGDLTCEDIETLENSQWVPLKDPKTILSITFAMERNAVHPIAKALTTYAMQANATPFPLESFKAVPGFGLESELFLNKNRVFAFIGHPEYIVNKLKPSLAKLLNERTLEIKKEGKLISVLLLDNELYIYKFRDTLRKNIKPTLDSLKKQMQLLMLTGDHEESAKRVADELGMDRFFANLRPSDKLQMISEYSQKSGLAMVGDGVNDAPALARATVGICMGKVGSTTAIDASDIILLQDNIELFDWLILKAKKTQVIVKQNLTLATCAILLASVPALTGIVPLWLAVILHEGGTVLVGLNALRLLR